jgi:hypothetical protein
LGGCSWSAVLSVLSGRRFAGSRRSAAWCCGVCGEPALDGLYMGRSIREAWSALSGLNHDRRAAGCDAVEVLGLGGMPEATAANCRAATGC